MAICALEGFWLPLAVEIAGLTETEGRDARNRLVDGSLLRTGGTQAALAMMHYFRHSGFQPWIAIGIRPAIRQTAS